MDEMLRDFYTKSETDAKFGGIKKVCEWNFDETDILTIYFVYHYNGTVSEYVADAQLCVTASSIFDETKIAIVLLDDEDNFTNDIHYENTIQGAKTYMLDNPENRYFVHIGDNSGIEFLPTLSQSSSMPDTFYNVSNMIYLYLGSCVTGFGSASESLPGHTYAYGALQNCTGLKHVEYSGAINYTYFGTFANCTSLEDFTIPSGVSEITSGMFSGCTNLHTLNVSDGVTTFRNGCCGGTSALSAISLPSSITSIESYAFSGSGLTQITIDKPSGSISGAPWGATNATVTWTG